MCLLCVALGCKWGLTLSAVQPLIVYLMECHGIYHRYQGFRVLLRLRYLDTYKTSAIIIYGRNLGSGRCFKKRS